MEPTGLPAFHGIIEYSQDVAAFRSRPFNLTGSGDPALLDGMQVTAGFFPVLGIQPIAGRTFGADDDQLGHEHCGGIESMLPEYPIREASPNLAER